MSNLDRRNLKAKHGFVSFPAHLRDTGEGGMSVFAIWRVVDNAVCAVDVSFYSLGTILDEWYQREEQRVLRDLREHSTEKQCVPSIAEDPFDHGRLIVGSIPLKVEGEQAKGIDLAEDLLLGRYPGVAISGAIYLGSSGGSWWDDEKEAYWCASVDDLTPEGADLLLTLNTLYGNACELITVLDT